MKITSVDLMLTKDGPFYAGKHRMLFIRIHTDEGIYGVGEAIVYGTGVTAAHALLHSYAGMLIGRDPFATEAIWYRLHRGADNVGGPISVSAQSAIDIALWDIKGKALGVPVYQLLGGKYRDKIPVYLSHTEFGWPDQSHGLVSAEDFYNVTVAAKNAGYKKIKANFMRVDRQGRPLANNGYHLLDRDTLSLVEERVAAVREALGPDGDIILENNATTGVETALAVARATEKYDILFYEEPIEPNNPLTMKQVAEGTSIPLATGERNSKRWSFLPFFENGSIRIAQPDVCNTGGITEMKKIADLADVYHVLVAPHVCGGPINHAAAVQVEAVIPNLMLHEHHVHYLNKENGVYGKYRYDAVNGELKIPDLPGIGQDISEEGLSLMDITTVK